MPVLYLVSQQVPVCSEVSYNSVDIPVKTPLSDQTSAANARHTCAPYKGVANQLILMCKEWFT